MICTACGSTLTPDWRIELPVPTFVVNRRQVTRPLTLNDRLHHHAKAAVVAEIRRTTTEMARLHRLPRLTGAQVQLVVTPPDRRHRDVDNFVATSKPAVDGIVDAGIIEDDRASTVTLLMPRLAAPAGRWGLALHIVGTEG
jgi:crossover junction endodeoxyribonuclease RusA